MASQEKEQDENIFTEFLNHFVKVVYDDFGSPQIAKGVLIKIENNFAFIKGNYKEQMINISKIIKISKEVDENVSSDK